MLEYEFMRYALFASLLGGAVLGVVGVWIVLMRIPFVGVAMSHAAFAGAVLGLLFHFNPLVCAMLFSVLSSFLIGPLSEKSDVEPNIAIGIIFSIVLGIAFLAMGLFQGPKTEALNLIWGNILLITRYDLFVLSGIFLLILIFSLIFRREIKYVLFNRMLARASGLPERFIFYSILVLTGISISFNLNTVGGLLIFSLIINPPSAAYQLSYTMEGMIILSVFFAILSCVAGIIFSYLFNLPVGSVIILTSGTIFLLSLLFSPKRRGR